ncbi:hypothetical protein D9M72_571490 [compost metagenome]
MDDIGANNKKRGNRKLENQHAIPEPGSFFASTKISFQHFQHIKIGDIERWKNACKNNRDYKNQKQLKVKLAAVHRHVF